MSIFVLMLILFLDTEVNLCWGWCWCWFVDVEADVDVDAQREVSGPCRGACLQNRSHRLLAVHSQYSDEGQEGGRGGGGSPCTCYDCHSAHCRHPGRIGGSVRRWCDGTPSKSIPPFKSQTPPLSFSLGEPSWSVWKPSKLAGILTWTYTPRPLNSREIIFELSRPFSKWGVPKSGVSAKGSITFLFLRIMRVRDVGSFFEHWSKRLWTPPSHFLLIIW